MLYFPWVELYLSGCNSMPANRSTDCDGLVSCPMQGAQDERVHFFVHRNGTDLVIRLRRSSRRCLCANDDVNAHPPFGRG